MKKRNLLISLLSLALVAVIGVGATLAYLTDSTDPVSNKFTFDNIEITLRENAVVGEGQSYLIQKNEAGTVPDTDAIMDSDVGIIYTDVLPGATVEKNPYITVSESNAHAYVYAYVTGVADPLSVEYDTTVWEVVPTETGKLLRHEVLKNASEEERTLDVFYKVKVASTATGEEGLNNITIQAYAHQADHVDVDTADAAAKTHFGIQ